MANDPRDLDGSRLQRALSLLGGDPALRSELIAWLKLAERRIAYSGPVRDDVTGPIIDALHSEDDVYDKRLADGTRFQFLYRTKIAREFLLADQEFPSHVWEPQTTRLLQYLTSRTSGDVVLGGAYFGDQAIILGVQLQGSGRVVHCFEPNTDQARMLRANADLNGLDDLRIQTLGLWNRSSERLMLAGYDSFANAVPAGEGEGFETVSIDDYAQAQKRDVGVIMLDIEGAEHMALVGASRTLATQHPAIVFEVHRDYVDWSHGLLETPIARHLKQFGYELYAVRDVNAHLEMGALPIELVPAESVYLEGPHHGFNMLAVSDAALLQDARFRIVPGVSPKLLRHKAAALHHPLDGFPD